MTDLSDLREALAYKFRFDSAKDWEMVRRLKRSTDSFLALTETGREAWWCHYHSSSVSRQGSVPVELKICDYAYAEGDGDDVCEVERVLVIPADYLTEEDR